MGLTYPKLDLGPETWAKFTFYKPYQSIPTVAPARDPGEGPLPGRTWSDAFNVAQASTTCNEDGARLLYNQWKAQTVAAATEPDAAKKAGMLAVADDFKAMCQKLGFATVQGKWYCRVYEAQMAAKALYDAAHAAAA